MSERSIEELAYALHECFWGEGEDGGVFLESGEPGLLSMLDGLNASEASKPTAGMSVANHVHHLIFAVDVFMRRAAGDADAFRVDWNTGWREQPLDDAEWAKMKKDLAERQEEVMPLVREWGGKRRLVFGLLTHTVFHLGIIRVKFDVLKDRRTQA
ncbi:MAG: hypothetical protein LBQ90_02755 [Synergistaceae bacterium]|jgi:hypothetical protein|nr:hypothetical protein [Synergistaceae bacterium]